ncbi:DNA-binding GntR family transcriptional regulator [Natronocella acetinitrilica]|uniref:DNA-binding GntR family transcriptional regulator n=1 Tax=Natronocella acetinitrilica TaxID=414046 RepID=A0AAE3G2X1_9GAMM|nr:DNA-binding GntR family transcriptional regulator [Natronocella acetinitrilica]
MNTNATSVVQKLRDALEDGIINGDFSPGEQLDIPSLASRFQVSRTPVREALQQLSISGLVTVIPKRGTFVAQVGLAELIQMFEVMAELEGMCGRLAARRIEMDQLEALEEALHACERAASQGAADEYYYENATFHSCIYDASQNQFLAGEAKRLRHRLKPYRRLQLRVSDRINRSLDEHRAIFEAIRDGDGEAAEQLMRDHVLIQGERFSDLAGQVNRMQSEKPLSRGNSG